MNTATARSPWRWRLLLLGLAVGVLILLLGAAAAVEAVRRSGYTPGQLMDHAERRLLGHPTASAVALPMIRLLRDLLDEPSLPERLAVPFHIPPPPLRAEIVADWPMADAAAPVVDGRVIRVGHGQRVESIAEAAGLARDGDIVEIEAGDYYGDVAVWLQKRLMIRAVGGHARLFAAGALAEEKAIWVFRDGSFDIRGIDFVGSRAEDGTGAGIRAESGRLIVRDCLFWASDTGILTGQYQGRGMLSVQIFGSEFGYLGHGDGQSHHVYVQASELFRVVGSYFHHGNVGHLIKSRSAVNDIRYNRITDEAGGRASYEIDLPNGGIATLVGNIVEQNRTTENPALIAYGLEGLHWPVNRLVLSYNTLVNEHPYGGSFLRVAEGSDGVVSQHNVLLGRGVMRVAGQRFVGQDVAAEWSWFVGPLRYDYRLKSEVSAADVSIGAGAPDANEVLGTDRLPEAAYLHPHQLRGLGSLPTSAGGVPARTK